MPRPVPPLTAETVAPGAIGFNRGVVKRSYAFMPPEGILDSRIPAYEKTILRFQTAPVMGARFAQAILEIEAGGGTRREQCDALQHFFLVLTGTINLALDGGPAATMGPDAYTYLPPQTHFSLRNTSGEPARVLMLKRPYAAVEEFGPPPVIVSHLDAVETVNHSGNAGRGWQHLLPVGDMRFDMEMNILSFAPGAYFPAVETHIMEHGLYMLRGQGLYFLESDWHEIWAEDFIWMGSYVPQQFYPTGWSESAYLLYKDVNRDVVFPS
jgi:(S)-ureidoglycine aminohydrolase